MLGWVDSLLNRWGYWAIRSVTQSVGYARCSPMFRDMPRDPGAWGNAYTPDIKAKDIWDCDAAISKLPRTAQNIIVLRYVMRRSVRNISNYTKMDQRKVKEILDTSGNEIARHLENNS